MYKPHIFVLRYLIARRIAAGLDFEVNFLCLIVFIVPHVACGTDFPHTSWHQTIPRIR
jgi:hypothetical protein